MDQEQGAIELVNKVGDAVAVSTIGGVLLGFLPHAASLLTVVWMLIRIWETETVQSIVRKWRKK